MKALYTVPQSVGVMGGHPSSSLPRWFAGRQPVSTWTPTTHVQRFFRCDHPGKLLSVNVSVGPRSGKLRLRGGPCYPPVTIVRRRRLHPAAQVPLLFHIRLLCLPPYQHNYRQVAPREAPTFVRTLSARMVADRNCPALGIEIGRAHV